MIRRLRLTHHSKTLPMLLPREVSTIDDDSAECSAMSTHELRQRMHHDIRAIFDRSQQNRRRHRVVHDQWDAVLVRDTGQRLNVANISRRISNTFAKNRARAIVDQPFYGGGMVRLRKSDIDSLLW